MEKHAYNQLFKNISVYNQKLPLTSWFATSLFKYFNFRVVRHRSRRAWKGGGYQREAAFRLGGEGNTRYILGLNMAMSLIQACRSLALSTWLLSFCFVHLLCLDFTVAEKEEWYTAFVNITYVDPVTSEIKTEKTECGRYGEHSPKKEARGQVLMPLLLQERQACDPNAKYPLPYQNNAWMALIAAGNCTFRDKIRNVAALHNASAVIIYNVGSTNINDTITMPHQGKLHFRGSNSSIFQDCMRCTVSLV